MIRNVKRAWFEVWGTEEAQNRFLKVLLVYFFSLACVESVALTILSLRRPPVVAVSAEESRVLTIIPPRKELLEAEVKRSVSGYMLAHYNWEWAKIDEAFKSASRYVHPDFSRKFLLANETQAKLAKEKKVSQRFYVSEATYDLKKHTARITGDRVLIVSGLRATNPMTFEIQFDYGPRTEENPEGVYIVGERLLAEVNGGER